MRVHARSEETDGEEHSAQGRDVDAFLCEPRIPNYGQRRNDIVGLVLSERIYALIIRMACSATTGDKCASGMVSVIQSDGAVLGRTISHIVRSGAATSSI